MRKTRNSAQRLVESLEPRTLLSGNVTAAVIDGNLIIRGDNLGNGLTIEAVPSQTGQYTLTPDATTTINNQSAPVILTGVTKDLRINLREGANALTITGVAVPGSLGIDTGNGNDTVTVQSSTIAADLTVRTRNGDDNLDLRNLTVTGKTNIWAGQGANFVSAADSKFEKRFMLVTKDGDDSIFLGGSTFNADKHIVDGRGKDTITTKAITKKYDFRRGTLGWTAGYSDYSPGMEESINFTAGARQLPPEIRRAGTGFLLSGKNVADDLFMYLTRRLGREDGLMPNQTYQVRFTIRFASNAPSGAAGIGGAPGESVWLKAGASAAQPTTSTQDGRVVSNIDHGEQATGGTAVSVVDDIANGNEDIDTPYVSLVRQHTHTALVKTDANGQLYLIVGTESGFEGPTAVYIQEINTQLIPVNRPSQEKAPKHNKGPKTNPDDKPV